MLGLVKGMNDLPPWIVPSPAVRNWAIRKGGIMARKRYSAEQMIGHLHQVEILISEGRTIGEAARQLIEYQRLKELDLEKVRRRSRSVCNRPSPRTPRWIQARGRVS